MCAVTKVASASGLVTAVLVVKKTSSCKWPIAERSVFLSDLNFP